MKIAKNNTDETRVIIFNKKLLSNRSSKRANKRSITKSAVNSMFILILKQRSTSRNQR